MIDSGKKWNLSGISMVPRRCIKNHILKIRQKLADFGDKIGSEIFNFCIGISENRMITQKMKISQIITMIKSRHQVAGFYHQICDTINIG